MRERNSGVAIITAAAIQIRGFFLAGGNVRKIQEWETEKWRSVHNSSK